MIAIRKDMSQPSNQLLKRGDLLDLLVIQIKGGSARGPTEDDCRRLREVAKTYRAKGIVEFQWRKAKSSTFLLPREKERVGSVEQQGDIRVTRHRIQ